ncbi:SIS domain-containing protein [Amylibacter sp.]|nr:SIS domain-containing protein [Amylibacter sp.]
MNVELVKKEIADSIAIKAALLDDPILLNKIIEISTQCVNSLLKGGKVIFCGNGGSFADAQHLSAEFTSRFLFDRPALASISLGTNNSGLTAMANDYGYENVFSRELEALGKPEDTLIGITTSGNSENILNCANVAKTIGIETFILTGKSGGKVKEMTNCLLIPSNETARVQECHILIGHIICGFVEKHLFK